MGLMVLVVLVALVALVDLAGLTGLMDRRGLVPSLELCRQNKASHQVRFHSRRTRKSSRLGWFEGM